MDAQSLPGQEIPAPIRTTAFWCHLSALSLFIGVPFGNVLGPLIIWQTQKERHPFLDDQGKEAMIQIVYTILGSIAANNGIAYRYPSFTIRFIA